MPRSIWKGAITFGLISIPVKLYGATEEKDLSFRQIHPKDGGRIKYKRVCEVCGEEVPFHEIAKGYESPDGRVAILEKSDFDDLPLSTTKAVEVVQFVDVAEVDPRYYEKAYVLEAEGPGAKPYVLLRDALRQTGKAAVVKVAVRSRESLALIRATDSVMMMHTMLWPDELRDVSFAAPDDGITASKAEVTMATTFITELEAPFEPEQFTDNYREALEKVVNAKLAGTPMVESGEEETGQTAEVVDLVAALKASVEAAKKRREAAKAGVAAPAADDAAEPKDEKKTTRSKKAS